MTLCGEEKLDLELEGNWEVSIGSATLVGSDSGQPDIEPAGEAVAAKSQAQEDRAYRVHLYAVVRITVDVDSASSQLDAIGKAEEAIDLHSDFVRGEYAEEVIGALVDEVGDLDHLNTANYVPTTQYDEGPDEWKLEAQRSEADRHSNAQGAKQFFAELLQTEVSLSHIVEKHGVETLIDLVQLQQAIFANGMVEFRMDDCATVKIVRGLPSSTFWLKYVKPIGKTA